MTAADPFTRASPHWIAAQRGARPGGPAFEWTGAGFWFSLPRFGKRSRGFSPSRDVMGDGS